MKAFELKSDLTTFCSSALQIHFRKTRESQIQLMAHYQSNRFSKKFQCPLQSNLTIAVIEILNTVLTWICVPVNEDQHIGIVMILVKSYDFYNFTEENAKSVLHHSIRYLKFDHLQLELSEKKVHQLNRVYSDSEMEQIHTDCKKIRCHKYQTFEVFALYTVLCFIIFCFCINIGLNVYLKLKNRP